MKNPLIELPPEDDLGPCMKALDDRRRRFVIAIVRSRGRNLAACARASGYSDHAGGARVRANEQLRNAKIIAAIKEEAERTLDATAAFAILGLRDLVDHDDPKIRQVAIDSVLDRRGFSRRTQQDIVVEHVDTRSTADLLKLVEQFRTPALSGPPVVEAEFEEVKAGG